MITSAATTCLPSPPPSRCGLLEPIPRRLARRQYTQPAAASTAAPQTPPTATRLLPSARYRRRHRTRWRGCWRISELTVPLRWRSCCPPVAASRQQRLGLTLAGCWAPAEGQDRAWRQRRHSPPGRAGQQQATRIAVMFTCAGSRAGAGACLA